MMKPIPLQTLQTWLLMWFLLLAAPSFAGTQAFEQDAFRAAQAAGKPILVAIHADWCTTCRAQERVVSELLSQPRYADVVVFRVDFDTQKDIVNTLGARAQSTLIVFKGQTEVARSLAQTAGDAIAAQLDRAL